LLNKIIGTATIIKAIPADSGNDLSSITSISHIFDTQAVTIPETKPITVNFLFLVLVNAYTTIAMISPVIEEGKIKKIKNKKRKKPNKDVFKSSVTFELLITSVLVADCGLKKPVFRVLQP